jgi:hypothetical protein
LVLSFLTTLPVVVAPVLVVLFVAEGAAVVVFAFRPVMIILIKRKQDGYNLKNEKLFAFEIGRNINI